MKYQRGGISESSTTSDNTSQFIEIVKKHQQIYNTHHPDYKNVEVKLKVWSQIAAEINLSVDASKRKWKNLRDSYTKYLRSFRVGTKTSKKYQYWAHADHMEFLKPYQGPGRTNTLPLKEDEDNECDLGYQVLAKATSNSGEDDLKTSITQTQTAINNSNNNNNNNANGIGGNISGLPLNTSLTCINPQLPTVVSGSSAIGLVNATTNTTTTAGGLVLPVPSLPTVQLPPSLIAMPVIGPINGNTSVTNAAAVASSAAGLPSSLTSQIQASLPALNTKTPITMPSSSTASSVGCLIIEPQLFASTDSFKKELTNSATYISTSNFNHYNNINNQVNPTTTTATRFNPALITKIRRVQPSPQTSAINLSFSTSTTIANANNSTNSINSSSYYSSPATATIASGPPAAKIRKTFDPDVTAILQANRDLDANTLFFLSLAKQVRAMPTKFQSLAKMRCMRIVSDIELELDNVTNDTNYNVNGSGGTNSKYCNLDSPTDGANQNQLINVNNGNESQTEHFVYVMSPSRVEGMIDLSSDEENTLNGN
uniref:MADF domain-containing protein n=1 Tax=Glossina austeni TaxID=7395 RepID=A0A1A9VCV8_GLOAU